MRGCFVLKLFIWDLCSWPFYRGGLYSGVAIKRGSTVTERLGVINHYKQNPVALSPGQVVSKITLGRLIKRKIGLGTLLEIVEYTAQFAQNIYGSISNTWQE